MDAPPTPNPDEPDEPAAGPSRRTIVVALVAGIVVLGAVIGAFALTGGDDDDTPASAPTTTTRSGGESGGETAAGRASTTTTPEQGRTAARRARAEARANARAGASTTVPSGSPGITSENGTGNGTGTGTGNQNAPGNGSGNRNGTNTGSRPTLPGGGTAVPTTRTPDTVSPTVEAAYKQGYDQGCRNIWAIAGPDGQLVDDEGVVYVLADCQGLHDSIDAFFYDTVADALAGGAEDASWNLSFEMNGSVLRNTAGTKSVTVL